MARGRDRSELHFGIAAERVGVGTASRKGGKVKGSLKRVSSRMISKTRLWKMLKEKGLIPKKVCDALKAFEFLCGEQELNNLQLSAVASG